MQLTHKTPSTIPSPPKDRLACFYDEYLMLYRKAIQKSNLYWIAAMAMTLLGWLFFFSIKIIDGSPWLYRELLPLLFGMALLVALKAIQRGRQTDLSLLTLMLKGARIEKKLQMNGKKVPPFFKKTRRLRSYFLRLISLVLILLPLFKFGMLPLSLPIGSFHPLLPPLVAAFLTISLFCILSYFILQPYWHWLEKYRALIE